MTLDLDAISPQQRGDYAHIAGRHNSELVLAHASDIAATAQMWAAQVAARGFGLHDLQRLQDGIAAHLEAGTQRRGAEEGVHAATSMYADALKEARRDVNSVLRGARSDLADAANTDLVKALNIDLKRVNSTGLSATPPS